MNKLKNTNVILLTGPPGSGKSTIGKHLQEKGNYFHISTGDLFRALTESERKEQAYYMDQGAFLPDTYIFDLLKRNLDDITAKQPDVFEENKLLLDGFPRTEAQRDMLTSSFDISHVLFLKCSDDISKFRCLERGKRSGRVEDTDPALIEKRLFDYHTKTASVFDDFSNNIITEIDTGFEVDVEKFKPQITGLLKGTLFEI